MKKLESTFLNMVLSLVLIAVVAAAGLAGIYSLTKEKIDDQQNQKRQAAIREVVLPNAEATVEIQITSDTIRFVGWIYVFAAPDTSLCDSLALPLPSPVRLHAGRLPRKSG